MILLIITMYLSIKLCLYQIKTQSIYLIYGGTEPETRLFDVVTKRALVNSTNGLVILSVKITDSC